MKRAFLYVTAPIRFAVIVVSVFWSVAMLAAFPPKELKR